MSIPEENWRSLDDAPRNGDIIAVRFREYNKPEGAVRVGYAHWACDDKGENWGWKKPFHLGTSQYAEAWMPYSEFLMLAQRPKLPLLEPQKEFDL